MQDIHLDFILDLHYGLPEQQIPQSDTFIFFSLCEYQQRSRLNDSFQSPIQFYNYRSLGRFQVYDSYNS